MLSSFLESVELRFDPSKSYTNEEYTLMMEAVCLDINGKLVANTGINSILSGSTGIIVLLHNEQLICANVGDSRAGLVKFDGPENLGSLTLLSRDHTPQEADEKERVLQAGGKVMPCIGRIFMLL